MAATILAMLGCGFCAPRTSANPPPDLRNIDNGTLIAHADYMDQPYVVVLPNGHWFCAITTGLRSEGDPSQHIVYSVSSDQGRTWSALENLEPAGPPEASWAVPWVSPTGRIYVFYNYNRSNIRHFKDSANAVSIYMDALGPMAYRYSDDEGRTWSANRLYVSIRKAAIDRRNPFNGDRQLFWMVGYPQFHRGRLYLPFAKIGAIHAGVAQETECFGLTATPVAGWETAESLQWETWPRGESGLTSPIDGPLAEEPTIVFVRSGRMQAFFRTGDGYVGTATSGDEGVRWEQIGYATYRNGRPIKQPRAFCPVVKLSNGKYLLWFHNNSETSLDGRNPVWVSGGVEENTTIAWSQPEILLYDSNPNSRISYPSWVEQNGHVWVTETQKNTARVHEVDRTLLEGLWNQGRSHTVAASGLRLEQEWARATGRHPEESDIAGLGTGEGFSVELGVKFDDLAPGQVLLRNSSGATEPGLRLEMMDNAKLGIFLIDGRHQVAWSTDDGSISAGRLVHLVVTYDASARVLMFLVDGKLLDGGTERARGWLRVGRQLGSIHGRDHFEIAPNLHGELRLLRIYDRPLRTSEAIANHEAFVLATRGS